MSKYFDLTDIKKIKPNPDNPRVIKDEAYQKLVKSIQDFPQMLELRPIVIDEAGVILGGNMRYRACIDAGMKKVPTVQASTLTEEQKREFVVKDNLPYGEWDWEALQGWGAESLSDWGLVLPMVAAEIDYSILDTEDVSEKLGDMVKSVKRGILIDVDADDYDEALQLVQYFRKKQTNMGRLLIKLLQKEKGVFE